MNVGVSLENRFKMSSTVQNNVLSDNVHLPDAENIFLAMSYKLTPAYAHVSFGPYNHEVMTSSDLRDTNQSVIIIKERN